MYFVGLTLCIYISGTNSWCMVHGANWVVLETAWTGTVIFEQICRGVHFEKWAKCSFIKLMAVK